MYAEGQDSHGMGGCPIFMQGTQLLVELVAGLGSNH
jgi:hypothetical protein